MSTEIIEGNKLIAEFCMIKRLEDNKYIFFEPSHVLMLNVGKPKWLTPENMRFHSSWDWLMPVVEKIETMWLHVVIEKNSALITWLGAEDDKYPWLEKFTDIHVENAGTKINATWLAVTQFIKWYQNQILNNTINTN